MDYLTFEKSLREFPVFSLQDIKKKYPDFDNRRLFEWQQKDYIQKIRREYYCFRERKKDEHFMFFAANKIYSPSYVSMETALDYYGFIPEGVFMTTSITSRNTARYSTPIGEFSFHHLKPSLFFGYKIVQAGDFGLKVAEPEKVILDYLYLKKLDTEDEIDAIRWNKTQVKDKVDFNRMDNCLSIFGNKVLGKRIQLLRRIINA